MALPSESESDILTALKSDSDEATDADIHHGAGSDILVVA
jgi:hypothetical protein